MENIRNATYLKIYQNRGFVQLHFLLHFSDSWSKPFKIFMKLSVRCFPNLESSSERPRRWHTVNSEKRPYSKGSQKIDKFTSNRTLKNKKCNFVKVSHENLTTLMIFEKSLLNIEVRLSTLLLPPFASKLVNDSSHTESLKTRWKSTFRHFGWIFIDSLYCGLNI